MHLLLGNYGNNHSARGINLLTPSPCVPSECVITTASGQDVRRDNGSEEKETASQAKTTLGSGSIPLLPNLTLPGENLGRSLRANHLVSAPPASREGQKFQADPGNALGEGTRRTTEGALSTGGKNGKSADLPWYCWADSRIPDYDNRRMSWGKVGEKSHKIC